MDTFIHDRRAYGYEHEQLECATPEALLEFANNVRRAGGGNAIPALLPSRPGEANACLIARALNFESMVQPNGATMLKCSETGAYLEHAAAPKWGKLDGSDKYEDNGASVEWVMIFPDQETRDKVALGMPMGGKTTVLKETHAVGGNFTPIWTTKIEVERTDGEPNVGFGARDHILGAYAALILPRVVGNAASAFDDGALEFQDWSYEELYPGDEF